MLSHLQGSGAVGALLRQRHQRSLDGFPLGDLGDFEGIAPAPQAPKGDWDDEPMASLPEGDRADNPVAPGTRNF
jgi:hypothetical protein